MTYRVTPLLVGMRNVDQGIMTYQQGYGQRIWLPMWSFLLRGEGRTVLVDTGLEDFVTPPEFVADTGLTPLYLAEALEAEGVAPEQVDIVINTHLHDDHCGNNPLFLNAQIRVQRAELDFALDPHPLDYRYEPSFIEDLNVVPVDGDAEILPGLRVLATPGHTPGSQTVVVETADGPVIIPGMCSNAKNYPATGPAVCPGVHCDAYQAFDTAQRLRAMPGKLLPLHELSVARERRL